MSSDTTSDYWVNVIAGLMGAALGFSVAAWGLWGLFWPDSFAAAKRARQARRQSRRRRELRRALAHTRTILAAEGRPPAIDPPEVVAAELRRRMALLFVAGAGLAFLWFWQNGTFDNWRTALLCSLIIGAAPVAVWGIVRLLRARRQTRLAAEGRRVPRRSREGNAPCLSVGPRLAPSQDPSPDIVRTESSVMSIFGSYFVSGLLRETGWPRKQGLFRKATFDTFVLDLAIDQMIDWAAALGAGRPRLALQVIAEMFRNRDWNSDDRPNIKTFIEAARVEMQGWNGTTVSAPHDVVKPTRLARMGPTLDARALTDERLGLELWCMEGMFWGISNPAAFETWYQSHCQNHESNLPLMRRAGG